MRLCIFLILYPELCLPLDPRRSALVWAVVFLFVVKNILGDQWSFCPPGDLFITLVDWPCHGRALNRGWDKLHRYISYRCILTGNVR